MAPGSWKTLFEQVENTKSIVKFVEKAVTPMEREKNMTEDQVR